MKWKTYRVIRNYTGGYSAQVKYIIWPFWLSISHFSLMSSAKEAARLHKNKNKVVWTEKEAGDNEGSP